MKAQGEQRKENWERISRALDTWLEKAEWGAGRSSLWTSGE